jgi:hypothetical protein
MFHEERSVDKVIRSHWSLRILKVLKQFLPFKNYFKKRLPQLPQTVGWD